jgi:alcohol dehydrogenase, propanol-preferring
MVVRRGGKILAVGTLDTKNTLDMKNGIRKRLSIIFTYGGQYRDLEDCLDLISRGVVHPQVEGGKLEDFPRVLEDLHQGKVRGRMALKPPDVEEASRDDL